VLLKLQTKAATPEEIAERQAKANMTGILRHFISRRQLHIVAECMRGEEKQFFIDKMNELADRIKAMPGPYGQEGQQPKIAYLHYFGLGYDWYIQDRDDLTEEGQIQAFGYANLNDDYNAEEGYICIQEIIESNRFELDFHFTPKPLADCKVKLQRDNYQGPRLAEA